MCDHAWEIFQGVLHGNSTLEALEADLVTFMRLVDSYLAVLRAPTKMSGRPKDEPAAIAAATTTPPWEPEAPKSVTVGVPVAAF